MDDTIAQVQTSGEAEKWFDKWFKNPNSAEKPEHEFRTVRRNESTVQRTE